LLDEVAGFAFSRPELADVETVVACASHGGQATGLPARQRRASAAYRAFCGPRGGAGREITAGSAVAAAAGLEVQSRGVDARAFLESKVAAIGPGSGVLILSMNMDTQKTHPLPDLRNRRQALGLSAEKLARLVDCSTGYLRTIEHGIRPSDAMAERIERALQLAEASPQTMVRTEVA
jgi:DNA-binding transcriptional regulator YiaG